MKINDVDMRIARLEGGSKSCDIAQIKEIRKIIAMLMAMDEEVLKCILANGKANLYQQRKNALKRMPKLPEFLQ